MDKNITTKKRFLYLSFLMVGVIITILSITFYMLYSYELKNEAQKLSERVEGQRQLVEAIGRFDAINSDDDHLGGSVAATLSQVIDARKHFVEKYAHSEFLLGKKIGDAVWIIINNKELEKGMPSDYAKLDEQNAIRIPMHTKIALPMKLALKGKSGTIVAQDYKGVEVLAAYAPLQIADSKFGIVVKTTLERIRQPFINTAITVMFISIVLTIFAVMLFIKLSNPIINELEERIKKLHASEENRKVIQQELEEHDQKLRVLNDELNVKVKNTVDELRQKDEILLRNSRLAAMGEMIGMIAHQWRQPITGIGMIANNLILDIELDTWDEKNSIDNLKTIDQQTQYLSKTIDDFRNFFKPNKDVELCKVKELIDDSVQIIEKSLENSNVEVILKLDENLELNIYKSEIIQVLLNLIKNAQDIFKEKSQSDATIIIESYAKDNNIIIAVEDNAGGIPIDIIDKIFNPYYSTKSEKTGTGLGLYMSKMIIQDHHKGILRVYNSDSGARFEIVL